jgi:hypothetical protein
VGKPLLQYTVEDAVKLVRSLFRAQGSKLTWWSTKLCIEKLILSFY